MKHPMSRKKPHTFLVPLPLMTNVTVEKAESVLPERSIDITGVVELGLNVVNLTFRRRRSVPVPVHFGTKAFGAFLRLAAEVKLRGMDTIVTALDLQREGIVPWGTASATMMDAFESIATDFGGDEAQHILGVLAHDPDDKKLRWTRLIWDTYIEILFDINKRQPCPLSSIRQRLWGTKHPSGNKAFLRANGWRPEFDYLHGYTSISKDESPDGADFAFGLGCPASGLHYNRAALLKHDDEVVRRIAAVLPV